MMGARVGLVFLFVLCASWVCDGRGGGLAFESYGCFDANVCPLCLEYASRARNYFGEIENQKETIETLRRTCSRVPPQFKQMCIASVDLFAPPIMSNLSAIDPERFCYDNHCEKHVMGYTEVMHYLHQDSCGMCHHAVKEVLRRSKDPDTQLKITEILVKICNLSDEYTKKLMCKMVILENGSAIFVNLEQYVKAKELCTNFCGGSEQISQWDYQQERLQLAWRQSGELDEGLEKFARRELGYLGSPRAMIGM